MTEPLADRLRSMQDLVGTIPTWRGHHVRDLARSWLTRGERNPLDEGMPWLAWPCIDWLQTAIFQGMRVFEYGGGGSTLFFLAHNCRVTTVEGNRRWAEHIRERAAAFGTGLELRYVDSQSKDPERQREYAAQAAIGGPWNLVLVDGAFRRDCLAVAREHLAAAGTVIVDNTDLAEYADVHAEQLLHDFDRRVFRGLGYARRRATTTEVFHARA